MIPANGLLMIPESSAGCVCLFSIASTIVLEPREGRRPWAVFSSTGSVPPVKHLSLNLGAPGDRRDARGRVWLSYPRPRPERATSLDLKLGIEATGFTGRADIAKDSFAAKIAESEVDWVSSSAARGLKTISIPLLPPDAKPSKFKVRLHFAELENDVKSNMRRFDVLAQGQVVLADFDIMREAGGTSRAIVREFPDIPVKEKLDLEFRPKESGPQTALPLISGIEIIRID